ncbi:class E sortase [Euzebya sp.]|uniref:class E sortase n=1 Tax=Euzebya sp. TaxID=1971409 RepID=UPI0035170092
MSELVASGLLQPDPLPPGATGTSTVGYLLDAVRLRPAGRRLLSLLSALLFAVGLATFAFPLFTDLYSAQLVQRPLADEFESAEIVERYATRTIATGEPLTRIVIPSLDVDTVVVEGTSPAALRAGAGHYPNTPLPGEVGNVAIAGHRTTYGKPFNELDRVGPGELIHLVTPLAVHTYEVTAAPEGSQRPCPNGACWVVTPTQWEVVAPTPDAALTLTTCHPKGSSAERLILRASLVSSADREFDAEGDPVPLDLLPTTPPATPAPDGG